MKICIASQTFAPEDEGGAEISARMAAIELARRQHDVTVLALGLEDDPIAPVGTHRHPEGFTIVRIPYHNWHLPAARQSAAGALKKLEWHARAAWGAASRDDISRILEAGGFDVLYAQNSVRMQPALFSAARALKMPIVWHLRDYAVLCPKTNMFRDGKNCEGQCFDCRLLTSRVGVGAGEGITAIAVSNAVRERILKHGLLTKSQWHVLYNTNTSEQKFDAALMGREAPSSDVFTFGYLGGLTEAKGVGDLVRAFAGLKGADGARLLVAGRGRDDYVAHLKELAAGKPVEFLGHVPPERIYALADVVVVPSRWIEPQGRIIVEAAVYGVPLIGTDRGGIPEVLKGYGMGWCYDPDQPDALSGLLDRALSIGQQAWWAQRDALFPGIRGYQGTAESSRYYEKIEAILSGSSSPLASA
ncbi:glycosyltransferase [Xanthobacter autotrophicus]|uniref:glycosyltransferase n=1 Tax=Xanthobacter TaxID=279 RepID=UPI0024ABBCBE|nr:glycosyltransferase [Xanthobacter autotrophicus]MDI4664837.1 glycosyltransferase [Xanthobacter autotrophicus]